MENIGNHQLYSILFLWIKLFEHESNDDEPIHNFKWRFTIKVSAKTLSSKIIGKMFHSKNAQTNFFC